jgi:hypothetical protein
MTDSEFQTWLDDEVRHGRMTHAQRDDLLDQKRLFDAHRAEIEQQHQHRVVGYVSGQREVTDTAQGLFALAHRSHPGRMVYFEPVG